MRTAAAGPDADRIRGVRWRLTSARTLYESWTLLVASKQLLIDVAGRRAPGRARDERLARLRAQMLRYQLRRDSALRRLDESLPPPRPLP